MAGESFVGHMLIVLDPTRVIMGCVPETFYWHGYTLEELVKHFDGDPACVNLSRVMRLPGFYHCKEDPIMVECLVFEPDRRYTQDQLEAVLPSLDPDTHTQKTDSDQPGAQRVVYECV